MAPRHILISRKIQTSREPTYSSHECYPNVWYCYDPVPCGYTGGIPDLEIGKSSCGWQCPEQNLCLKPDKNECNIGLDSKGNDPLFDVEWDEKAPKLKCVYDLDNIDKIDQIEIYKSKFPNNHNVDTIIGSFCGKRTSSNCPKELNGECSRYLSLGDDGKLCRLWLADQSESRQDALMRDYCLHNDTEDCKCIKRNSDPSYNKIKALGNYFSDNCWYRPCSNSESVYLVPNKVSEHTCATNVCQQIIDAHADGDVDISNNINQINCTFNPGDIKQPKKKPDNGDKPPSTPSTPSTTHWYDIFLNNWKLFVGITVAFVLIIIMVNKSY